MQEVVGIENNVEYVHENILCLNSSLGSQFSTFWTRAVSFWIRPFRRTTSWFTVLVAFLMLIYKYDRGVKSRYNLATLCVIAIVQRLSQSFQTFWLYPCHHSIWFTISTMVSLKERLIISFHKFQIFEGIKYKWDSYRLHSSLLSQLDSCCSTHGHGKIPQSSFY